MKKIKRLETMLEALREDYLLGLTMISRDLPDDRHNALYEEIRKLRKEILKYEKKLIKQFKKVGA